ncbi:MAG: DUF3888 domain-containing protein [Clostridium luticellarii]|uniref:DUF3888 domain-containing protein n=1 Tax=Clostridium luticellarii TaxID=1691940 RepID=UPI002355AA35|nr:DUF3888 domain-containing protein [Clostridium luticellarii]MCI2041300.1 DUF3888 domain-containing protein [Clostridium luticellarii]
MIGLKKSLYTLFLALLIIFYIPLNIKAASYNYAKFGLREHCIALQNSKEKLYQDMLVTLLLPILQNAVDNYYKEYLSVSPVIAPYDISVLSIDRLGGNETFDFCVKLELHPYVGPHLDVGLDHITIKINSTGRVKVEKFEHIRNYELPSYYQDIIKKKLP